MAKREYSNGLQHLKFMQRAKQREEAARKAEEDATSTDDSHWVLPANMRATGRRCTVIVEGDPKPGALLGRMSFQNCNAAINKLAEEAEALQNSRRFSAAKEKAGPSLSVLNSSSRVELAKEEETSAVKADDESTIQLKKPKVGILDNPSSGFSSTGRQGQSRNDKEAWQGWRSQGDYRMLRPPPKG